MLDKTQSSIFNDKFWLFDNKLFRDIFHDEITFDVDVIDLNKEIMVNCSLPGVEKENVIIELKNNILYISCERKKTVDEKGKFYKSEIVYGRMKRAISLSESVIEDTIKATFKNGILKITLEKIDTPVFKKIKID